MILLSIALTITPRGHPAGKEEMTPYSVEPQSSRYFWFHKHKSDSFMNVLELCKSCFYILEQETYCSISFFEKFLWLTLRWGKRVFFFYISLFYQKFFTIWSASSAVKSINCFCLTCVQLIKYRHHLENYNKKSELLNNKENCLLL